MYRIIKFIGVALCLGLILTGCAAAEPDAAQRIGQVQGQRLNESANGEKTIFTFNVDQAMLDSGSQISVQGKGLIEQGWLRIALMDPENQEAWSAGEFGGDYSFNTYIKPSKLGQYRWIARWKGATAGTFDLSYQALGLSPVALLSGLGMALVAVGYIIYAFRSGGKASARGKLAYLGLGALAWVVTVAVKFLIAMLLNPIIYKAIGSPDKLWTVGNLVLYVYIGALTGLTEVLITWLVLRYTRLGQAAWPKALAFGIGFGAIEALLLGLTSIASVATALAAPQLLPADALGSLIVLNNPLYGSAPVIERLAVVLVHIFCCALLFYGVLVRQSRWLWVSFAFKTGLDTVAAFAQFWGVETMAKLWTIEAFIIVFGLIAWWGIGWVKRRYPAEAQPAQVEITAPAAA